MSEPEIFDVIVVGFGPSGAAAANAAGALGLRTLVVERDLAIFDRQRAIALDDEALRVIRGLGLYDEVTAHMHLGVTARFVGVDGKPFLSTPSGPTSYTGYPLANFFHQPALEHALREGLERFSCVQIRPGQTASLLDQGEHAVTLQLTDEQGNTDLVSGRYVLACDGGSSPLRKQLGIPFAGSSYAEQWMDVQARVKRPLHRPPHFDFVCSPERPGVRCPCPDGYYRWEWRINPGEDADAMLSEDNIWRMLAAEGVTPDDIEIARTWSYTFHVRKAQRWRVGRILLLGDAAHVMPPFAGQGISGAFRDAANVVWKVDAVIRGRADETLLDTYQTEREPHHDAMTQRAVTFGKVVMTARPSVARLRDKVLRSVTRIPGVMAALVRRVGAPTPLGPGCLAAQRPNELIGYLVTPARVALPGVRSVYIDDALGTGWAILGLDVDPRDTMSEPTAQAWERVGARFFTIRPGTSVVQGDEIGDPAGQLWDAMVAHGANYLVVRPDKYVYAATEHGYEIGTPMFATAERQHRAPVHYLDRSTG
ncbi:bifunctional 3-(3-hydroxy-phenyl)propionate/3-hydroxycinnamic acid hydroxylase [Mycolicibacterium obuense]|uniref:3-(3-hydroxy-phenyl)propionate/3-hydroxycinnamic acid hydroxylase n=1 Tax=Mycolicibacterium obuense TaxID=1807 RepID=A0A0J6ZBL6_9MYCO|nr:bifunctional 3-(3-hydroxy-phenyl)propionate/3-hydroxycinnamic acid hydroxylase [Mycolicibacterium obuense]KMO82051.1 3-(3-hydroxy-phenyl)propionate/3-hydroxycinnamic acid hydroxylase [Mycolicibacterium obuense]